MSTTTIQLPVAPTKMALTRFSPPPQRHSCLSVRGALELLERSMGNGGVSMAVIAGPGDPLATPEITLALLQAIRRRHAGLPVALSTYGCGSGTLAAELARAGLSALEMKVEGIRRETLEKIFAWIRPGGRTLRLREAAEVLLREQRFGVAALAYHAVAVTIRTTLYPDLNEQQIGRISLAMMELGAAGMALVPYAPEQGAEVKLEAASPAAVDQAMRLAQDHLPLMAPLTGLPAGGSRIIAPPSVTRPRVAVATSDGCRTDLHLGQARRFSIYGQEQDGSLTLFDSREAPEPGCGSLRWRQTAELLSDCSVLLCAAAGQKPCCVLGEYGLRVVVTEERITDALASIYGIEHNQH